MKHIDRKLLTRVSALVMVLMLLFSFTASFAAASFTSKGAGIKYNGTFKLNSTTSEAALKKAFGKSYTREVDNGCTFGVATYRYNFSSRGIMIETLQKKEKSKEKIITIEVTKKTVPTIAGLRVGDKTSKLAKLYGKKCKINKSKTQVVYETGDYVMRITARKGIIKKIEIVWVL